MVRGQRLAGGGFARVRIYRRPLDLPLVGDRLHLGLVIAEIGKVAERDEAEAMTGGADLLVDLQAALQLLAVERAKRAIALESDGPGLEMELVLHRLDRGVGDVGARAGDRGDQQNENEAGTDQRANQTYPELSYPLLGRCRLDAQRRGFRLLAVQHAFRDRPWQRQRPFDRGNERPDDEEVRELIDRRRLAAHHERFIGRKLPHPAEESTEKRRAGKEWGGTWRQ